MPIKEIDSAVEKYAKRGILGWIVQDIMSDRKMHYCNKCAQVFGKRLVLVGLPFGIEYRLHNMEICGYCSAFFWQNYESPIPNQQILSRISRHQPFEENMALAVLAANPDYVIWNMIRLTLETSFGQKHDADLIEYLKQNPKWEKYLKYFEMDRTTQRLVDYEEDRNLYFLRPPKSIAEFEFLKNEMINQPDQIEIIDKMDASASGVRKYIGDVLALSTEYNPEILSYLLNSLLNTSQRPIMHDNTVDHISSVYEGHFQEYDKDRWVNDMLRAISGEPLNIETVVEMHERSKPHRNPEVVRKETINSKACILIKDELNKCVVQFPDLTKNFGNGRITGESKKECLRLKFLEILTCDGSRRFWKTPSLEDDEYD